ncbi:MAG TPA: glycosyltransferase family 4 protein, partial [Vicinamibacterales bacterium]|nr:glycosyltransferase family 4 protein [Vicinamibacterales bacterium]
MQHVVVMVTTSYPRFHGDSVGTFMEPIAKSIAARGHEVHVVAPWHPLVTRGAVEDGVTFHFFRYAPLGRLNVFGYAAAMRADVTVRRRAYAVAPLALAAGWAAARRVARRAGATVMHGHWVVPGGAIAAAAAPSLPLVVSLHGSDLYVAEQLAPVRRAVRAVFRRTEIVTSCSSELARRAVMLGADPGRIEVIPYGVDVARFRPDRSTRLALRERWQIPDDAPLVAAAGRLVRKKGLEYLIDAMGDPATGRCTQLVIAGDGDLREELAGRARARGVAGRVRFLGNLAQDDVAAMFAAADVVVVPSVRDDGGNVDGLPNVVLEALASATPVVTTAAGGIGPVVEHGTTALVVPERDSPALASAIG